LHGLALNHDPPNLCLLSREDYRVSHQHPARMCFSNDWKMRGREWERDPISAHPANALHPVATGPGGGNNLLHSNSSEGHWAHSAGCCPHTRCPCHDALEVPGMPALGMVLFSAPREHSLRGAPRSSCAIIDQLQERNQGCGGQTGRVICSPMEVKTWALV
jgi:hypothetical protein